MQEQPWEAGWTFSDGPAPGSARVGTKVVQDATYHLWKNDAGDETIQKNAQYFKVSPGAFNTIPTRDHGPGTGHGITADKI